MNIRINVIVPKKPLFDKARFLSEVKSVMHKKTAPELRVIFKGTTEGWKDQPDFQEHHFQSGDTIGVQVYTRHNIYGLVNAGSPPHRIAARQGGRLAFQWGYISATKPGSLKSYRAIRAGSFIHTPVIRRHPGFEARKFDEQIAEEYRATFEQDVQQAVKASIP